jgi:hypothetical protein
VGESDGLCVACELELETFDHIFFWQCQGYVEERSRMEEWLWEEDSVESLGYREGDVEKMKLILGVNGKYISGRWMIRSIG